MAPLSPPLLLPVSEEGEGVVPLRYMNQPEKGRNSEHKTYVGVEDDEMEEEKGTVVPVILNCSDWARMAFPVGFFWTKLIWKPLPVGQPVAGPSTVVEPEEVRTFSFNMMLTFGVFCCRERNTSRRTMQVMDKRNVGQAEVS